jgi:hypothetical protein
MKFAQLIRARLDSLSEPTPTRFVMLRALAARLGILDQMIHR